ncbi:MAG: hypothetical protein CMM46_12515 [Rhodospirillaceae bacterium]|nr:hypothetical protein [Rhodospirillaceae bacterium]|tara:strand:+ start:11026 stop:11475 length:450 start_codon:yes stop_codon:yes gene_type:complete
MVFGSVDLLRPVVDLQPGTYANVDQYEDILQTTYELSTFDCLGILSMGSPAFRLPDDPVAEVLKKQCEASLGFDLEIHDVVMEDRIVGLTDIDGEILLVAKSSLSAVGRTARTTVSTIILIHTASSIHWAYRVDKTVANFDSDEITVSE